MIHRTAPLRAAVTLLCATLGTASMAQDPASGADASPWSLGATLTLAHLDNVRRAAAGAEQADLRTNATVRGNFDQSYGIQRYRANAELGSGRYQDSKDFDSDNYRLGAQWDWASGGRLQGSLGLDAQRQQRAYGVESSTATSLRNSQEDRRAFFNGQYGGFGIWTLYGGLSALQRRNSETTYQYTDSDQASVNGGVRYAAHPDLTLSAGLNYTRGEQPNFSATLGAERFAQKGIDLSASWQASGASSLQLQLGYVDGRNRLQADRGLWNGSLGWMWVPSDRLQLNLTLRQGNSASQQGLSQAITLTTQSVNTSAQLAGSYLLGGRTSLNFSLQEGQRQYDQALVAGSSISGKDRSTVATLGLSYRVTEAASLSCSVTHDQLRADASVAAVATSTQGTVVSCSGTITLR
jgi:hypothetical protein